MSDWIKFSELEKERLITSIVNSTKSMREAAVAINVSYQTFRKYAKRYNVWKTNRGKQGGNKPSVSKIPLQEILEGKHPSYGYGGLKARLLRAGIKRNECEECQLTSWRGKPLTIQLDHRNGDRYDHRLENLRMLCPNCHSQTETYCGRNC